MLRITVHEEADQLMLKLEGRIVGPWALELDRTWRSLGSSLTGKQLCVDLRGVSYIDWAGRGILADIYQKTHARFQTASPLMEYFAEEARKNRLGNRSGNSNGNGNGNGPRANHEKGAPK